MSYINYLLGSFRSAPDAAGVFRESASHEKGFAEHYNTQIKPLVNNFERKRKKALEEASKRARLSAPVALIIAAAVVLFVLFSKLEFDDKLWIAAVGVLGPFGVANWWTNTTIRKYHASIKSQIFPRILSFLGDFEFYEGCGPMVGRWKQAEIIPDFTNEKNEDYVKGSYKGVDIELFESHLQKVQRSGKNTRVKTVFNGVVVNLSVHKEFKGKTIIRRDAGMLLNFMSSMGTRLERVKLEDPQFEDIFEVYSNDQIEARYLLTTAFMERLTTLANAFHSNGLQCAFFRGDLFMMIPTKDNLFEPGSILKSEDFVDDSKALLADMHSIFRIIDILKLELNIGM